MSQFLSFGPLHLSRRRLLKLSAGALLGVAGGSLWPGRLAAADVAFSPLKFAAINDLHYADDDCAPFFEGLVKRLNAIDRLDFVLLVGDLTDNGRAGQAHALHDILAKLAVPYHFVIGNHDYWSPTQREPFDGAFGEKLNYTLEVKGWQLVGLDTTDGVIWQNTSCRKHTLDFVATLPSKLDRNKPTLLFTHFPLGPGVTNRLVNADALLEPFKALNLAAIFNGHHHGMTDTRVLTKIIATTYCCCSRKAVNHDNTLPKGFCLATTTDAGRVERTFIEYGTDFPGSARPATQPATALPVAR